MKYQNTHQWGTLLPALRPSVDRPSPSDPGRMTYDRSLQPPYAITMTIVQTIRRKEMFIIAHIGSRFDDGLNGTVLELHQHIPDIIHQNRLRISIP